MTILLVEQDVQEALDICDRAYVIQTGRVVLEGRGIEDESPSVELARISTGATVTFLPRRDLRS